MTSLTSPEVVADLRLDLSRATLALLDGDARLAALAQRGHAWSADEEIRRIEEATIELASVASKRAPKGSVPDRLHPIVRAMAREVDAMIESAAAGRPVDPAAIDRYLDEVVNRTQSGSWQYGTKAARRAINLSNAYAAIAECAGSLSGGAPACGRRVA